MAALVASLAGGAALAAQAPQPPADTPAFEVASIKPNNSGDGRIMMQNQPGRYIATNVTLRLLIRNAYQLQDFQITGGPGWMASDHFDINAKVPDEFRAMGPPAPGSGPGPLQLMIRALLTERFKLVVHNETKDAPIYALILARADGKLGPGLKKSSVDCTALFAAGRARGGAMPPPPQPGERMQCGMRIGPGNLMGGGALTHRRRSDWARRPVRRRPDVDAGPDAKAGRWCRWATANQRRPRRSERTVAVHRGAGAAGAQAGFAARTGRDDRGRPRGKTCRELTCGSRCSPPL
jgi:hypothetical protein